jgi:hypothetical protein
MRKCFFKKNNSGALGSNTCSTEYSETFVVDFVNKNMLLII